MNPPLFLVVGPLLLPFFPAVCSSKARLYLKEPPPSGALMNCRVKVARLDLVLFFIRLE